MININYTYYGDHFALFVNIDLFCCIPETNVLYFNYMSVKNS